MWCIAIAIAQYMVCLVLWGNCASEQQWLPHRSRDIEGFMRLNAFKKDNQAFSLVEIMIVLASVGLLAALAIPGLLNARKQSQGRHIVNDCQQMDTAICQWALATGRSYGATIDTAAVQAYLRIPWHANDLLGNAYNVTVVGTTQITINAATKTALYGVGIDWGAY